MAEEIKNEEFSTEEAVKEAVENAEEMTEEVTSEEVVSKAREGIKWCRFASTVDPNNKKWEYKLVSDNNIHLGNSCKYTLGTAHTVKEEN